MRIHACAAGVHPSGPLDDASLEGTLATARRLAWKEGIARAILLEADQPLRVDCAFLLMHDSAHAVGRAWTSADVSGRPGLMALLVHAEGAPVEWLLEQSTPRLIAAAHMCRQTRSQQLVRLAVGELRSQLEDATVLSVGAPRASIPTARVLRECLDVPAAHARLADLRRAIEPMLAHAQRGVHASVPLEHSQDATLALRAWAHAARTLCPHASHVLALSHAKKGVGRIDLFLGDVSAAAWVQALRDAQQAHAPAMPLASAEEARAAGDLLRRWASDGERDDPRSTPGSPAASGPASPHGGRTSRRSVAILVVGVIAAIGVVVVALATRTPPKPAIDDTMAFVREAPRDASLTAPTEAEPRQEPDVTSGAPSRAEPSTSPADPEADATSSQPVDQRPPRDGLPEPFQRELDRYLRAIGQPGDGASSHAHRADVSARMERAAAHWARLRDAHHVPTGPSGEPEPDGALPLAIDADRAIVQGWREHCDGVGAEVAEQAVRLADAPGGPSEQPVVPSLEGLARASARVQALRDAARAACVARSPLALGANAAGVARAALRDALDQAPPTVRARATPVATTLLGRLDVLAAIEDLPAIARVHRALRDAASDTQGARDDEAFAAWRVATAREAERDPHAPEQLAALAALLRPAIARAGDAGRTLDVGQVLRDRWTREAAAPDLAPDHAHTLLDALDRMALTPDASPLPSDERADAIASMLDAAGPQVQRARSLRDLLASADASADVLAGAAAALLATERRLGDAGPADPRVESRLLRLCEEAVGEHKAGPSIAIIDALGPGAAGWSVVPGSITTRDAGGVATVESVEFESPPPNPVRVRFARSASQSPGPSEVAPKAGAGPAFIATRETSVAQASSLLATHADRDALRATLWRFEPDADPRQGPRSWTWIASGGIGPAPRWARAQEEVVQREGLCAAPSGDSPMNYVSPQAARALARAMGCRLPSLQEWSSLLAFPASPGDVSPPNLRDAAWGAQAQLFAKVGARALAPAGDVCWPVDAESIPTATDLAQATATDDACAWFWSVDQGPRVGPFANVVGNVAEWVAQSVADGDDVTLVAGGSALSPLGVDPRTPRAIDPVRASRGYSDVGFRPAFDAPDRVRPESAKSALRRALRDLQSSSTTPKSQAQDPKPEGLSP